MAEEATGNYINPVPHLYDHITLLQDFLFVFDHGKMASYKFYHII